MHLMLMLCWFVPIVGTKMSFTQHLYLVFAFIYCVMKYLGKKQTLLCIYAVGLVKKFLSEKSVTIFFYKPGLIIVILLLISS